MWLFDLDGGIVAHVAGWDGVGCGTLIGPAHFDEMTGGMRDKRALTLDEIMKVSQAVSVSHNSEAGNPPDHLAQQIDNCADIVDLNA